jgi:NADPH-dependent glutamate synthase beta subunit-like oxidoreductase
LPVDVVEKETAVIKAAGVKLHFNHRIENPAALLKDGYNTVIVAVGAHKGRRLPIPGNGLPGVLTATEFLRGAALGEEIKLGRRVLILGGGNVAFDCAGTAKRMGAESVSIACLEPRGGMTASNDEIDEALKMGVEILNSRSFEAIDEGLIVSFCSVKQFAFVDGSLNVEKYPDSLHRLEADTVIFAAGQSPDLPEDYPLKRTRGGLLEADTGIAGIYAAGDAVSGTASVIQAIAMGREAAQAADRYLGGDGNIDESFTQPTERSPWLGHEENFAVKPRCTVSGKTSAKCEANRCLQCDLRLQIPKVKFWSEYSIR